jgi:hypothetical protein
MSLPL